MSGSPGTAALRLAAIGCHCALLVAGVLSVLRAPPTWSAALGAALLAAPLLLTLRPLIAVRARALQWLAVLLVPYTGAAAVEVVASRGAALAAEIALLAAVAELGVLLALIRRASARATTAG